MRQAALSMALLLTVWIGSASAVRADGADVVNRYLADDVIAVASVDLTKLDLVAWFEQMESLGIVPEHVVDEARRKASVAQEVFAELPRRGATRAYVLFRASDLQVAGTSWVFEVADDGDESQVAEFIENFLVKARDDGALGPDGGFLPRHLETADGVVLAATTPEQLAQLKAGRTGAPASNAQQAVEALVAADAGFVVFGDADTRRVVRELLPAAPAPFMEIDGRLLADGVAWGGVLLTLPPDAVASLTLEGVTPEAAATIGQAAAKALELLKAMCLAEMVNGPPAHKERAATLLPLVPLLAPTVDGTRITLTLGDDPAEIDGVRKLLIPAVNSARDAASRAQRMNNFKQLGLAMFNYENVHKSFPAAASYDDNGRALLSWRVHILPYLEQQALYNEFHLDEPWDSEHNRTLIERMPAVFADPSPAVQRAIGAAGRTTTLVPVGEGLLFGGRTGTKLKDVTDGLSNTILVVEVIPERAVIWTKPDDWEVEADDPLRGVQRGADAPHTGHFVAGIADGSVRMIASDIDAKVWAALLTIAGGEAIPAF